MGFRFLSLPTLAIYKYFGFFHSKLNIILDIFHSIKNNFIYNMYISSFHTG